MNPAIIIPARSGSKGVNRKNVRLVGYKPLVYWSIKCALSSSLTTNIFVSTNDPEVTSIAASLGVETLHRPAELATDHATMADVLKDILTSTTTFHQFDSVILLQPTAPFRLATDIRDSWDLFSQNGSSDSVISVTTVEDAHPARMYTLNSGSLVSLDSTYSSANRQDLPPVYHRNGSVYISSRETILSGRMLSDKIIPYIMPPDRSLNIDSPFDLLLADLLMRYKLTSSSYPS